MKLIILGAPGAGKGTQAVILADKFGIPHISTGDIFRSNIKNGTELGREAKKFIDQGMLVPDEITIEIIKDRLKQPDCKSGYLLDGFPRTIPQAEFLDKELFSLGHEIDHVLNIRVKDEEIIRRISGRRICPACGMSYHIVYKPAGENEKCNSCGVATVQREDDCEETVKKRLKEYHIQTEPLIEYYEKKCKLLTIDGREKIEDTTKALLEVLKVNYK